jgi:hypothetical protein
MAERDNDRMRFALFGLVVIGGISLIVACTGGPGSFDQGSDTGEQYGSITPDQGGNSITVTSSGIQQTSTSSTTSSGISSSGISSTTSTSGYPSSSSSSSGTTTSSSSTSSSSSGVIYQPQPDIVATDYSQVCAYDFDCEAIHQGPVCNNCFLTGCANAAIATTSYSQYATDRSTRYGKCDPKLTAGTCTTNTCTTTGMTAYCDALTKKCKYGVEGDAGIP